MNTNIEKLLNEYGALLYKGIDLAEADMQTTKIEENEYDYAYAEGMKGAYLVALGMFEQMFADFGQTEVTESGE